MLQPLGTSRERVVGALQLVARRGDSVMLGSRRISLAIIASTGARSAASVTLQVI